MKIRLYEDLQILFETFFQYDVYLTKWGKYK
jgi:hypothetical protein